MLTTFVVCIESQFRHSFYLPTVTAIKEFIVLSNIRVFLLIYLFQIRTIQELLMRKGWKLVFTLCADAFLY